MSQFALQLAHPEPSRVRLATLELQLACRERELAAYTRELQTLQARYLRELGGLHAQLVRLEQAVADAEVRAGLRPPPEDAAGGEPAGPGVSNAPDPLFCGNGSAPSDHLKRMFREIARTVHPDRATDDATRFRRHSIMAEANRAYAERDADRLRLIMRSWRHGHGAVPASLDDDPQHIARCAAHALERLAEIEIVWADLSASAIAELKRKLDRTHAQGWDLFAEMVMQVTHEIARQTARLIVLGPRT